mmetsp:Transcript_41064/g.49981  ORF Transcript_41064/g.49981 Transcript_41064/m.49981 type:complete len:98 (-) Transcript_41064:75-368(-)
MSLTHFLPVERSILTCKPAGMVSSSFRSFHSEVATISLAVAMMPSLSLVTMRLGCSSTSAKSKVDAVKKKGRRFVVVLAILLFYFCFGLGRRRYFEI